MNRIFEHPNLDHGWKCPICNESTVLPVILVPIPGAEDGNITEAKQIHRVCALVVADALREVNR